MTDHASDLILDSKWAFSTNLNPEVEALLAQHCGSLLCNSNAEDTLQWTGANSSILTMKDAWNLVRSRSCIKSWSPYVWSKFMQ